VSEKKHCNKF